MSTTRCGAKTRRGEPCQGQPMANGRCRMHGGSTPSGIASSRFTTGRYSKALPTRLLARYEAARTDPELLNLSDDLATVEARISDVLSRVESGDAGETWQALEAAWDAFRIAQLAKDGPKTQLALATIGRTIETGAGDWAAWREVLNLIERRRKLVESEGRRRIQMADMTDNAEVMALLQFLGESVKRHVSDRAALAAIQADLSAVARAGERAGGDGV